MPEGGYTEYGVDALGMNPEGYPSNNDKTIVDHGFAGCGRDPQPDPPPVGIHERRGHAARRVPGAALGARRRCSRNLREPRARLRIYDKWGFRDSVNVQTGRGLGAYLSLDQGIIMAAIGNALAMTCCGDAFDDRKFRRALHPVIGIEEFGVLAARLHDHRHAGRRPALRARAATT